MTQSIHADPLFKIKALLRQVAVNGSRLILAYNLSCELSRILQSFK